MINIFDDGILEATIYPSKWVFVRWIQNKHGRLQKRLIKDLNLIETIIFSSKLPGWFTDSELEHTDFHKLLLKFGCYESEIYGIYKRFMKPISRVEDLHKRVVI